MTVHYASVIACAWVTRDGLGKAFSKRRRVLNAIVRVWASIPGLEGVDTMAIALGLALLISTAFVVAGASRRPEPQPVPVKVRK